MAKSGALSLITYSAGLAIVAGYAVAAFKLKKGAQLNAANALHSEILRRLYLSISYTLLTVMILATLLSETALSAYRDYSGYHHLRFRLFFDATAATALIALAFLCYKKMLRVIRGAVISLLFIAGLFFGHIPIIPKAISYHIDPPCCGHPDLRLASGCPPSIYNIYRCRECPTKPQVQYKMAHPQAE